MSLPDKNSKHSILKSVHPSSIILIMTSMRDWKHKAISSLNSGSIPIFEAWPNMHVLLAMSLPDRITSIQYWNQFIQAPLSWSWFPWRIGSIKLSQVQIQDQYPSLKHGPIYMCYWLFTDPHWFLTYQVRNFIILSLAHKYMSRSPYPGIKGAYILINHRSLLTLW